MRKKFMLVAALAGILSLGACVDDKESASVEAIRNAKAEQLKSVAAMNNATAEATKLAAEAQAALNAIAAELAKVQLESEKAALAVELAGQEQKLEAALLQAQADLAKAKQDYLDALKGADEQEKARLQLLLSDYTTAAADLITYKNDLAGLNRALVQLEYNLVDVNTQKERDILSWNNEIAYAEAEKAAYEKYTSIDKAEAEKAYEKANSELKVLQNTAKASSDKITVASTSFSTANTKLTNSAYYGKLQNVFMNQSYGGMYISSYTENGVRYYGYDVTDEFNNVNKVALFTARVAESTDVEYVYDDQTGGATQSYTTIKDFYTVQKDGFDSYIAAFKKFIKDNQEKAVKDAQKEYDDAVADEETAKEAAEATGAGQQEKDAYTAAHNYTLAMKDALDAATEDLNDINEELAEVEAAYAFVTSKEQTDAVKAMVDSYNSLAKEICDLRIQNNKDNYVVSLKNAEVTALYNIYNGATDIVGAIQDCEDDIQDLKRKIADMQSVQSKEEAIELKKVEIANKEVEIAAKEKEVAAAKAAFEAAANA